MINGLLFLTSFQQESQVWKFTRTKYVVLLAKDNHLSSNIRADVVHFTWLSWFVKGFNCVWCELVSSCQECSCKAAGETVSAWWAVSMAKVAIRIAIGWCVAFYVNVVSSSECGPLWGHKVHGICFVSTILPCLKQFNRRPSWFVHQWK